MRKNQRWASSSIGSFPAYAAPPPLTTPGSRSASFTKDLASQRLAQARGTKAQGLMGGFAALKMELREYEGTLGRQLSVGVG